jgi:hypothetical protein
MSVALRFFIVFSSLSLAACNERKDLEFFKKSGETQRAEASKMTTEEVYRLYKLSFEMPPPPTYQLLPVLRNRGYVVIRIWVDDLGSDGALDKVWEYGPMLRELRSYSRITICDDSQVLEKAAIELARRQGGDTGDYRKALREYC